MPDKRRHRGPSPKDDERFSPQQRPRLAAAAADLSWLLGRGYSDVAALKLVGDKRQLDARQRLAVRRCAAPEAAIRRRQQRRIDLAELPGEELAIDGFNLITTLEAALGGAVLLIGRDGALRDMASMHGSYKRVEETLPALEALGARLAAVQPRRVSWWLDAPVSNSGRLAALIRELAEARSWPWEVELVPDADAALAGRREVIVSADRVVIDAAERWLNLARILAPRIAPAARILDLSRP